MRLKSCNLTGINLNDTSFGYTLSIIGGKYKMIIMYWLSEYNIIRFNELKRFIGNVSYKTLSMTLKQLESDNVVIRKEYPQIPPKVEYSLSERGRSLIPILNGMYEWGENNRI